MGTSIFRGRRRLGAASVAVLAALCALGLSSSAVARHTVAPSNSTPPSISGDPTVGKTLTANTGSWNGSTPMDFTFQWQKCTGTTGGCTNIRLATDRIYTIRKRDTGFTIRVKVTAKNADGTSSALSDRVGPVKPAPADAPTTNGQPTISGTPRVGEVLTAGNASWQGTQPMNFTYRWRRCDNIGGTCVDTHFTGKTYIVRDADAGHTMRVVVTATNRAGASSAISNPTAVIQPRAGTTTSTTTPPPSSGSCTPISAIKLPERLIVDRITYNPTFIHSRTQPLVAHFHVTTTAGHCVSGAAVYAVGVPFDRLSKAPETLTGGDGWATVSFRILPTFQLRPGNLVVIFVRARKPGESVLAGVSTRRLVSVRVA